MASVGGHWWDEADKNPVLQARESRALLRGAGALRRVQQDHLYDGLSFAYFLIAVVALVQLARIQLRVPEFGWTTQKVFHLLNFTVAALRCVVFATRQEVERLHPAVWRHVLLDLPGLLFFSTYSLLVLFWAEIFHAARSLPTSGLRPAFVAVNAGVYSVQACVWLYLGAEGDERLVPRASSLFIALVNIGAASGFLLYGGRLFYMLRAFPIESKGRRKKLREVGLVTLVCTACFTARASLVAYAAFHTRFATRLDVLSHPILNCGYYGAVEVLPAALVLYILRKLPPKRAGAYTPVASAPPPQPVEPAGEQPWVTSVSQPLIDQDAV